MSQRPPTTNPNSHFGRAWVALALVLAVHVADEAANDFLATYNPLVSSLRERFGWFPMPTFTFETWLTGLIFAVISLLALGPFAFRGARWMVPLAFFFGGVMLLNGMGHIAGSLYWGRLVAGVYSSPLLLISSVYLLWAAARLPGKQ